ncbi:MAG TPA: glycosyltransferase family 2 protein [Chthoniobacterales bacterium]
MDDLTIVVLTKNEERDLPNCLAALAGLGTLVVLDSGSTDRTLAIAAEHGVTVWEHPFESFGKQRNWALDRLPHGWTLFLDADEVATPEFKAAVVAAMTEAPAEVAGYYCCWKMMLDDVWLKRADNFPKWQLRLVRNGRVRFIDAGHGQKEGEVQGRLDWIREPYLHFGFSKGWSAWIDRHNRYSSLEARDRLAASGGIRDVFTRNASLRNKALKPLVSRIPFWPLIRFTYTYLLRGGFLEGRPGFTYTAMLAIYEFLIQTKMREIRRQRIS